MNISFLLRGLVIQMCCVLPFSAGVNAMEDKAGLTLQSTRVIYPASATGGINFSITNNNTVPYLMQTRVLEREASGDKTSGTPAPFIALPPLKRVEPGDKLTLRIRLINAYLRQDRESLFTLALKAIPSSHATEDGLVVATQNNLKLFYRPAGLPAWNTENVSEKLRFHRDRDQLKVENPTPYWVTFCALNIGGQSLSITRMVPPFDSQVYQLINGSSGNELSWQLVSDYGQCTAVSKQILPSG